MITGPGVFNAAHALTAYLELSMSNLTPDSNPDSKLDLVVQIGIAGVFKQTGLKIGDIAIAASEQYIHTGVESDGFPNDPLPFDLIGKEPESRKGLYLFDEIQVEAFYAKLCQEGAVHKINIEKGPFITVSTITASFDSANRIYKVFSPLMEAMEGAASAHIAALYDIPMIEVRAASNFVGERDKSKWDTDMAIDQLGWACCELFDDIAET